MTKAQMIETIQAEEAKAWLEFNRYTYFFAPTKNGYFHALEWLSEDETASRLRSIWATLHDLMLTLHIESIKNEDSNLAWEYHGKFYRACKEAETNA